MQNLKFLMITLLFLTTGCVAGSSYLAESFPAGTSTVYTKEITVRGKTIPLLPGEWKIVASGMDKKKFFKIYLIQEFENKQFNYTNIQVDTLEVDREYGYVPWKALKRKDMHYVIADENSSGEAQDGWYVNNLLMEFTHSKKAPIYNKAVEYIRENNLVIPNDMIKASHRLTGKHPYKKRYLRVNYYYNPELDGFAPGPKASWATSDWNAMRISEDPQKVVYMDNIIDTHNALQVKIKAGFHP